MHFTILDVFPLVQGILAVNEVDTLSTSIRHRDREESFYLKIVPVPCYGGTRSEFSLVGLLCHLMSTGLNKILKRR